MIEQYLEKQGIKAGDKFTYTELKKHLRRIEREVSQANTAKWITMLRMYATDPKKFKEFINEKRPKKAD